MFNIFNIAYSLFDLISQSSLILHQQPHSMTLTLMPPLDQGPHLPGETAKKETVTGGKGMRRRGEGEGENKG